MIEVHRALTIWQPWCSWISHLSAEQGGKRIENRTWAPPDFMLEPNATLWLHAGKSEDKAARIAYEEDLPSVPFPRGCIIGRCRVIGWVREDGRSKWSPDFARSPALAANDVLDSKWFCGPVGWVLARVFRLPEPQQCRGAQGLWIPPQHVWTADTHEMRKARGR